MVDGFLRLCHVVSSHASAEEETSRKSASCRDEFLGLVAYFLISYQERDGYFAYPFLFSLNPQILRFEKQNSGCAD
jgi:hypothetical protein